MQYKIGGIMGLFLVTALLLAYPVSAGLSDWMSQIKAGITGHATSQSVNVNVTIGNTAPRVVAVTAISAQNPTEDGITQITFNFTANDTDGSGNLKTIALANLTKSGETTRSNVTCTQVNTYATNYANYSCSIGLLYYDGSGTWTVTAQVNDTSNALGQNTTTTFTYNQLSAFTSQPASLTWAAISPGSTNQSSNNHPILLNNTGNKDITDTNVQVNATNLKGETDNTKAIWAANMTLSILSGGNYGCAINTNMSRILNASYFEPISNATLSRGNHSINDGSTGQEQLYACIRLAGSELSSQAYSTFVEGSWTVKII